jgi:hypothetical protein
MKFVRRCLNDSWKERQGSGSSELVEGLLHGCDSAALMGRRRAGRRTARHAGGSNEAIGVLEAGGSWAEPALEELKFTYRVTWSLFAVLRDWIGDGIGCAGWYREGQCWVVYSMYVCISGRMILNSRLLALMSRRRTAGVTYTTVLLLPASLRRIAWRGGGCPIVRPQIVTVEMSHMHELLPGLEACVGGGCGGELSVLVMRLPAMIYMLIPG